MKSSTLFITLSLGVLSSLVLPQAQAAHNCIVCAADTCATGGATAACADGEDACQTAYDAEGKVTEKKCIADPAVTDEVHSKDLSKCKKENCNDHKSKAQKCLVCPVNADKGAVCPDGKSETCAETDNYCAITWNPEGHVTEKKCTPTRAEVECEAATAGTCFCHGSDCNTKGNVEAGAGGGNETTTEEVSDGASHLCQTSMLTGLATLIGLPLLRA